jgi:hypothetical protein
MHCRPPDRVQNHELDTLLCEVAADSKSRLTAAHNNDVVSCIGRSHGVTSKLNIIPLSVCSAM